MSRALIAAVAFAVALPAVAAAGIFNPLPKKHPAPALAGVDPVTGKAVSLSQWRGKPVLVHIWGSWCPPCREEAPRLGAFLVHHPGSLLGIDVEDSKAGVRSFLKGHHLRFPNIFDPHDAVVSRLNPIGTPSTYVLDRRHRIVAVIYEPATAAQLEHGWKLANA